MLIDTLLVSTRTNRIILFGGFSIGLKIFLKYNGSNYLLILLKILLTLLKIALILLGIFIPLC
jgi:hypothetical protein